jgi:glycosyltransferase involved in cell wall biosynthesis
VIYTPHGFAFVQARGLTSLFYLRLEGLVSRLADRLIAVSDSEAETARQRRLMPLDRVVVIPNGIDLPLDPKPPQGALRALIGAGASTRIVAMVSRLSPPKAPEDLIRAAARAVGHDAGDRLHFVFLGSGPLEDRSKSLARRLGLERRVAFLGEREDVADLLPEIDILALCSESEGMPFSLLEAMAAGKPVVGSRVPGIKDLIADDRNGFTYPAGDAEALAAVLLRLAADDGLRRRLGAAGRRMVERSYTSERMVDQTEALYQRLLAAGAGAGQAL